MKTQIDISKRTKGEWVVDDKKEEGQLRCIRSADNGIISVMWNTYGGDEAKANAAFMVKACNTHDKLVEALKVFCV
jgi:hypothetical protein